MVEIVSVKGVKGTLKPLILLWAFSKLLLIKEILLD
jgi:hypothetical protein